MTLERIVGRTIKRRAHTDSYISEPEVNKPDDSATRTGLGVLLIDMQDFFVQHIADKDAYEMIRRQVDVLDYCRRHDVPVFFLEFLGFKKTIEILSNKAAKLRKYKSVIKRSDDGFEKTDLAAQLHAEGVRKVMLMGINASYCVKNTAAGAINNGFSIMTSRQLIADEGSCPTKEFEISIGWYKKNGQYDDDYTKLLRDISAEKLDISAEK